jgi:hypothetical protein
VSCQVHAPAALPPGKEPPVPNWIKGSKDPRAGLDDGWEVKILDPTGTRPARSQSLYRLSYPGSFSTTYAIKFSIYLFSKFWGGAFRALFCFINPDYQLIGMTSLYLEISEKILIWDLTKQIVLPIY